ncbi:MAG: HD domain-containing protein [Planctomycetota bacterium]|jgi:putative hydrolase of HD superfamily|nr:HD domain-containing protein [Planctomycetota bacterium]MDP6761326.1 HD domain-containing protein [Planctomycetota bacterium]MDP6991037.1 HD domain-containing protein [Planctomycetota bacterium]
MDETLRALLALTPLDALPRTGWIQHGIAAPESVAGHLTGTALLALTLAPRVEPALDVDRCVALALVHDAPEALTGDLPHGARERLPEGAKATAEAAAAEAVLAPLSPLALARFAEVEAGRTREARLVRLCDRLALGVRLVAYLRAGHRGLGEFVRGIEELDCEEFPPAEDLRLALVDAIEGQA